MDADGVRERVKSQYRKDIRTSDTRKNFLQKYARIISGVHGVKLGFGKLAYVDMEKGDPEITIPGQEFDQPVTDYGRDVFDLMMQESLTIHEISHILYTNYRSFKRYFNKLEEPDNKLFKQVWNALEDGAIEQQVSQAYSVGSELKVMNANMVEQTEFGTEQSNGDVIYTMHEAITTGLADLAIFDSGSLKKIMADDTGHRLSTPDDQDTFEDFVPEIEDVVRDVLSTPKSKHRNKRIYQFFEKMQDVLDDSQIDGRQDMERGGEGDGDGHPIEMMPDDTEGHTGQDKKDAYMLGDDQQMEDLDAQVSSSMPGGDESTEEFNQDSGSGEQGDDDSQDDDGFGSDVDTEDSLEEEYEDELENEWEQQAKEQDGIQQEMDEAVKFLEAIDGGTSNSNSDWDPNEVELEIPEPRNDHLQERFSEAKRKSKGLENILKARLQSERETENLRNQRRGTFDSKRMVPAAMGSTRVFEQEIDLNKKDYDCVVVYDRSGSMNGRDEPLEVAGGMLAMALNNVGVNTSVIGLEGNDTVLELPFGAPVDSKKGHMFRSDTGGGTPLSKAVFLARHRLMQENSNPFMIVITDGMPDTPSRYKDELMKCTFPVIGVHVNTDVGTDEMSEYFHRVANVTSEDLSLKLKRLIQQVMF